MTRKISPEAEDYLILNSMMKTVRELSDELGIRTATIRSFFCRHDIPFFNEKMIKGTTKYHHKKTTNKNGIFNVNEYDNWIA